MKHIFRKSIFHEPYCYVLYLLISLKNIHPNIQDIYIYLLILLKIFIYPPKISILIMKFLYISNSYLFSRSEVIGENFLFFDNAWNTALEREDLWIISLDLITSDLEK